MRLGLTAEQKRCLDAVRRLTVDGVPPSYEALRCELGLSSRSGVSRVLNELRTRGYVEWLPAARRSLRVLDDQFDAVDLARMSDEALLRLHRSTANLLTERGYRP